MYNIFNIFLSTILVICSLICSFTAFQATYASTVTIKPLDIFYTACKILNEKYYFHSGTNLLTLQNKYADKIYSSNDAHKYIKKIISRLGDPYTRFLTKEEFKEELDIIKSTLVGIGIKLGSKKPVILDVLPDSPAHLNDIKPNDYIIAVNDKSTKGLNSHEVAQYLKGPKGSILKITLKRGNEVIVRLVKREEINFKAVSGKELEDGFAIIKITSFVPANTSKLFTEELLKLMPANGLIIDLRNNSGGLLKNAVEIADIFLSEGKIVTTVQHLEKTNEFANSNKLFNGDIVILVNENTASASEILTSALKENKRAIVIGKRTYGKGLVQEIVKLPDESAIHVTTAAYLTPSGRNIDKVGLIPDKIIRNESEHLKRAKEILIAQSNKSTSQFLTLSY